MIDVIGIAIALLTGAVIGLLLAVAHYQRAAARRHRYEREVAQGRELHAAVRARLDRYTTAGSRNSTATTPW